MTSLFQEVLDTAARGAEGLAPDARATLVRAVKALARPDGGFAGLDGRSDPYYTFFAWLGLRALGVPVGRRPVRAYMSMHRRDANPPDAWCARFLLAAERRFPCVFFSLPALLRGDTYGALLTVLAVRRMPRRVCRWVWRRQRAAFTAGAFRNLPTPRLAAGAVLARFAARDTGPFMAALAGRRCSGGGFASAAGAPADLLATAAARFARGGRNLDGDGDGDCAADLAFIEACWQADGLFGASPAASAGDAEHTFYGLLALGTCR